MNAAELKALFPNATESFIRRNARDAGRTDLQPDGAGAVAELERHPGHGAVGTVQVQTGVGRRVLVRVTAIRCRLLDEDNLAEKYHVDLCRYAGIIPSDAPGKAKIEVRQQKAEPGAAEEVRIEVFRLG